jgi:hypothetical protein
VSDFSQDLPLGVSTDVIAATYPRLYHLTHVANWESICTNGLLSTSSLLDHFGVDAETRRLIERCNRRESVPIGDGAGAMAIIRDQIPMDDRGLQRALTDGITPTDWYRLVNQHVFFWVDKKRVATLLGARAYRRERHALLVVKTRHLLEKHVDRAVLSPLNTGATKPMPHPRGKNCFVPLAAYPFEYWRMKRGRKTAVVELAVPDGVRDLADFLESVSIVGRDEPEELVWSPPV